MSDSFLDIQCIVWLPFGVRKLTCVFAEVKQLCRRLTVVPGEDRLSIQANENATILMKVLIRSTFCSKRVIEEFRLSNEAFDWLIGEVETKFQHAQVRSTARPVLATTSVKQPAVFDIPVNWLVFNSPLPSKVSQLVFGCFRHVCLHHRS